MPVTVHIPTALRKFTGGAQTAQLIAAALPDMLDQLGAQFPDISRHIRDDRGEVRRFVNIYVNDEDIRFLGGAAYRFRDGDVVLLVPSIAGGATSVSAAADTSWVAASAPASSANLGCAFDCAAIAMNLRLRARALLTSDAGFVVSYRGPNADRVPNDASNLVTQGMMRFAAAKDARISSARVEIESEIPVGVGLGSSAAATICGLLLGSALLDVTADREEILALAAEMEGHPDNAAACCHGGLVFAASQESGGVIFARTLLPPELRMLVIVPATAMLTRASRAVLPQEYSRADVVHNLQRASLLAARCFSGVGVLDALQQEFFRDRLHQPYRVPAVPGLAECLEVRHPGLLGVYLSGSGSAALAFVRAHDEEIAGLLVEPLAARGANPTVLCLRQDEHGAQLESIGGIHAAPAQHELFARAAAASEDVQCRS
ncbi:MAG TPA: homoserine kinase [Candidatus Acidoferrales bacterium]|nr:homoserine kinase [Candidatus Acidoferrales bacterium]